MNTKKQWVTPQIIKIDVKGEAGPQGDGLSTDFFS